MTVSDFLFTAGAICLFVDTTCGDIGADLGAIGGFLAFASADCLADTLDGLFDPPPGVFADPATTRFLPDVAVLAFAELGCALAAFCLFDTVGKIEFDLPRTDFGAVLAADLVDFFLFAMADVSAFCLTAPRDMPSFNLLAAGLALWAVGRDFVF